MNDAITEAHNFYLPFQILASSVLAVFFWLIGLLLAWLIWGRSKRQAIELDKENSKFRDLTQSVK